MVNTFTEARGSSLQTFYSTNNHICNVDQTDVAYSSLDLTNVSYRVMISLTFFSQNQKFRLISPSILLAPSTKNSICSSNIIFCLTEHPSRDERPHSDSCICSQNLKFISG